MNNSITIERRIKTLIFLFRTGMFEKNLRIQFPSLWETHLKIPLVPENHLSYQQSNSTLISNFEEEENLTFCQKVTFIILKEKTIWDFDNEPELNL